MGRLRKALELRDAANTVFNLGIGGDDTFGLKRRISAELAMRAPDIVIIGIGVNDTRSSRKVIIRAQATGTSVGVGGAHSNICRVNSLVL